MILVVESELDSNKQPDVYKDRSAVDSKIKRKRMTTKQQSVAIDSLLKHTHGRFQQSNTVITIHNPLRKHSTIVFGSG